MSTWTNLRISFGRILMDLPEDKINTKKSFPWEEFDNTIERTKGGLKVDFKDKYAYRPFL